jgi:hypothetical protein
MKTHLEESESQAQTFEDGPPEPLPPSGHEARVCYPLMDEDDAREDAADRAFKDASRIGLEHIQNVLSRLHKFKGDGHFAITCAMVAHGMWSLLTERDQVEIANRFARGAATGQMSRANVCKMIGRIQERLDLPPTLGQRSAVGCANMSKQRKGQLKGVISDQSPVNNKRSHGAENH